MPKLLVLYSPSCLVSLLHSMVGMIFVCYFYARCWCRIIRGLTTFLTTDTILALDVPSIAFHLWVHCCCILSWLTLTCHIDSDLVEAMVTNGFGNQEIRCSPAEIVTITPPSATTCQSYMGNYINTHGGYLLNPTDALNCQFCSISLSNTFLCVRLRRHYSLRSLTTFLALFRAANNMFFSHRWRDMGFMAAYIIFNVSLFLLSSL